MRYDGVKIKPPAAWGDGARLSGFARAMWSGFVDQSKQSAQAHAPLGLDAPGGGLLHRRPTRTRKPSLLTQKTKTQNLQKGEASGCPTGK